MEELLDLWKKEGMNLFNGSSHTEQRASIDSPGSFVMWKRARPHLHRD